MTSYVAAGLLSPALSDAGTDCTDSTQLSLRLVKRPLVGQPLDSCKKRRKQSMPIRISTNEPSTAIDDSNGDGDAGSGNGVVGGDAFLPPSPIPPNQSPVGDCTPTPLNDYTPRDHSEQLTVVLSGQEQGDNHHNLIMIGGIPRIESPLSKSSINAADVTDTSITPSGLVSAWIPDPAVSVQGSNAAEHADWLPLQGITIAGTAPLYMSHLPQSELQAQSRNPNQPSIRIFNPEAYCELCNKEFCNKYFLKTHKANKHRIYSDPPVAEMLMNIPSFSAPIAGSTQIKKSTIMLNVDVTKSNDSIKSISSYNCEVCGKVFSYKILLINHKKNFHGIIYESAEQEVEQSEKQLIKMGEEREPGQVDRVSPEDDLSLSKVNTFLKNGLPVDISLVKEDTYLENDDSSFNITSNCKISPVQVNVQSRESIEIAANRLRRLGIMNPEAFCEICCKEYCNKYFLRTHKMKRHGILIPDDNTKDNPKHDQSTVTNSWYQIQTSPLNLIMGEQNTNSSGSYGERKSSPTDENECDMCGMRFQTSYLAQLHASINCKPKAITDITEPENKMDKTSISNVTNNNEKYSVTSSADAISEDLQKLQSMILQLNNLGENKTGNGVHGTICSLCNKELENRYFLQAHMMAEHNILPDESIEDKREREREADIISGELLSCKLCGRDGFTNAETFKQHMLECHSPISGDSKEDSNDPGSIDGKAINPDRRLASQVSIERRSSISLTPTSSYCEICNKELCNKYFMKTHMQRMHGIEIENGAQIGGVVCNICNKELCSKYFLRVHKHNTHGIVEEGSGSSSGQARPVIGEIEIVPASIPQIQTQSEAVDNALKPDLADLSHRYFSHFSEVCSICSRRFRSTKWLKAHLLADHGKAGSDKWNELEMQLQQSFGHQRISTLNKTGVPEHTTSPMLKIPNGSGVDKDKISGVQNVLSSLFGTDESNIKQYFCSFCSFSTPVLAFLFVHERSHSQPEPETESGGFQCGVCNQTFRQHELLQHHVLSQHPLLPIGSLFGNVLQQSTTGQGNKLVSVLQSPEAIEQNVSFPERIGIEHRCSKCNQWKNSDSIKQTAELGFSLKDVSKQSNLPATYALPQTIAATKYVMQAFLMDEPAASNTLTTSAIEPQQQQATAINGERKFAPSIVFLPVLEKLNAPLTVSFTLTPT